MYSSCCSQAKDCMSYKVYSSYQYLANLLSRCSYLNMGWVRSMSRYQGYKRIIDNETSQWAILFHEEVSTKRWVTCFCGGVGLGGEPTWSIGTPTLTNVGCKYTSISQIKCLSVHHTLRIKLATTLPLARKATGTLWLSYVDLLCNTHTFTDMDCTHLLFISISETEELSYHEHIMLISMFPDAPRNLTGFRCVVYNYENALCTWDSQAHLNVTWQVCFGLV